MRLQIEKKKKNEIKIKMEHRNAEENVVNYATGASVQINDFSDSMRQNEKLWLAEYHLRYDRRSEQN